MEGKVIYQGKTKSGLEYSIRYPKRNDAEALRIYINQISKEKTFIRLQGEELSIEDEQKYLKSHLEKIEKHTDVLLLIVSGERILGDSGIEMKDKTESHEGVFGISIAKEIRGERIGRNLMQTVIDEAIENIPHLRLITLGLFGDNELALSLYAKFGFVEFGRLPEGSLHNGNYVDHIYMYKKVG